LSVYEKNRRFFVERHQRTQHAAECLSKIASESLASPPLSVVDVGCGVGTFLHTFKEAGATRVHGLEGTWLDPRHLVIDRDEMTPHDLEDKLPEIGVFDLAICLEVAEHLTPKRADQFINELCQLAPAVLFSAAIPFQGGVGHFNEQWPSWWAERFMANGYQPFDCIRREIWSDEAIGTWYRQNTILYLQEDHPACADSTAVADLKSMDLVHPEMFLDKTPGNSIPKAAKAFRRATTRTIKKRVKKCFGRG
jgi:SAM-dependent methyltransferase